MREPPIITELRFSMFSTIFEQCVVAVNDHLVCYVYRTSDRALYTISTPTTPVKVYTDLDVLSAQCVLNEIWSKAP